MNLLAAPDYVDPASFDGPVGHYRIKALDLFGKVIVLPAHYSNRGFAQGLVRLMNKDRFYPGDRCVIERAWVQPIPA